MRNHLRPALAITLLAIWGSCGMAQSVVATNTEELAPISPTKSPGPMSLDTCLDLGMQHQPSLDAARASLAAASSGQRALQKMIIPRLFTPDLGVRRQQACLGVTIASAALTQAEWDTRYAITRNFFTVQYIRSQTTVIDEVHKSLSTGRARAKRLFDAGEGKVTKLDLDNLDVHLGIIKTRKSQVDNGMLKALAALREAMGLAHDYPLEIAATDLPMAVYAVEVLYEEKVKDEKGKEKIEKKTRIEYHPVYKIEKTELISAAIANRGEMVQASAANRVSELEIEAQRRIRGWRGNTFAMGGDIHAQPIPQGIFNFEYRPGAIGLEMPPMVAGRKADRVQRVSDLFHRSNAVVDKTTNLVSLDVEAQYLKWQEALERVQSFSEIRKVAVELPGKVEALNPNDFTSLAVIQSNTTAIQVRTSLNEEIYIHALALAGLERATAGAFRIYPVPAIKK